MGKRLLTTKQVLERVGLCASEVYSRIREGTFPKQVPLGPTRIAFLESEIDAWIDARLKAREQGEGAAFRRKRATVAEANRKDRSGRPQRKKALVS